LPTFSSRLESRLIEAKVRLRIAASRPIASTGTSSIAQPATAISSSAARRLSSTALRCKRFSSAQRRHQAALQVGPRGLQEGLRLAQPGRRIGVQLAALGKQAFERVAHPADLARRRHGVALHVADQQLLDVDADLLQLLQMGNVPLQRIEPARRCPGRVGEKAERDDQCGDRQHRRQPERAQQRGVDRGRWPLFASRHGDLERRSPSGMSFSGKAIAVPRVQFPATPAMAAAAGIGARREWWI